MFATLQAIHTRPKPFEFYTAEDLWTDAHTSARMLEYHLNGDVDVSSRNAAFIGRSVAWIVERFGVDANTRIIDFGCGPGLYASRLARAGARVTGVDFSARSLAYARGAAAGEGPGIEYIQADYLDFAPAHRADLALMIMCDFCALGPEQRARMLRVFRDSLRPGGAVLLDAYSLAAFAAREESAVCQENLLDGFWSPERYFGFLNVFKYEAEKVVLDKYTIVEPARTRTVYNWLQYFTPQALQAEFEAAGFRPGTLYADVAGTAFDPQGPEFALVAELPD